MSAAGTAAETAVTAEISVSERRPKTVRVSKWYYGGVAGSMAACVTHPLDLLKVILQTESKGLPPGTKLSIVQSTKHVVRSNGIIGLYNGLSASIMRQLTYSTTRFGIYEVARGKLVKPGQNMAFHERVLLAAVSGASGGLVGTPADMINVRMQNDMKLPAAERRKITPIKSMPTRNGYAATREPETVTRRLVLARLILTTITCGMFFAGVGHSYKNAFDGLYQVLRQEGVMNLFNGASMAVSRAIVVTIGQISFYEQVKQMLLATPLFDDNIVTHLASSFAAGAIATTLTQPLDVLKTRTMNAAPGQYAGVVDCVLKTGREGPLAFFKGYIPAFVRLGPHTILMWLFLEQMRLNFGHVKSVE